MLLEKTEFNGTLHIGATADNGIADVIFWVSMLSESLGKQEPKD